MELNERITKVIEYTELSPAEFAEEINVQRSSISHIISGRNKPSLDFITKIKTKFPELEWEWLITGVGEMLVKKEDDITITSASELPEKKPVKKSLPDLFSLINDDQFGYSEPVIPTQSNNSSESDIPVQIDNKNKISDSQRLEKETQISVTKISKIKRIIFFYEDGTFESYQN